MRLFLSLIALLFLSTRPLHAQDQVSDFQHAELLYRQSRYEEALKLFNKAAEAYPANGDIYYRRGYCLSMLNRFDDAKKDFQKAAKLGVNTAKVNTGMGFMYNEAGKYRKAITHLTKAISLNSSIAEAYTNRGLGYQYLGQLPQAIADYTEAIRLDPGLAMAYNNRGSAIYENQDIAAPSELDIRKALKDFSSALHYDPSLCIARMNRGLAYSFLELHDSAIAELDLAARCNPHHYLIFLNRGDVKYKKADYAGAVSDYMEALGIQPNLPEAYMQMGKAKSRLGYLQEAIKDQEKALSLETGYKSRIAYNIASHYAAAGRKAEMMLWLKKAKKAGYFKNRENLREFGKNEDFEEFLADKEFKEFAAKVK